MTNFEKWKAGLTPENTLDLIKCAGCPLIDVCQGREHCAENFVKWANSPAEEDTKWNEVLTIEDIDKHLACAVCKHFKLRDTLCLGCMHPDLCSDQIKDWAKGTL